jgi:hypothetical protein
MHGCSDSLAASPALCPCTSQSPVCAQLYCR